MSSIAKTELFWRAYFVVYDRLCTIRPYQKSISSGAKILKSVGGKNFLDIGCGTGNSTSGIWDRGSTVIGIDSSESALEIARKKHPQEKFPGMYFLKWDFNESLEFGNSAFEGVFAHNAMYLARDPVAVMLEIHRVLSPRGLFVMSNPIPCASPFAILKCHVGMSYQEFKRGARTPLLAEIKMIWEAADKFFTFLAFLPFQIALKNEAGGAAHFWDESRWEKVLSDAKKAGAKFKTMSVEPSYADQNLTFALLKE